MNPAQNQIEESSTSLKLTKNHDSTSIRGMRTRQSLLLGDIT